MLAAIMEIFTPEGFAALMSVVAIDLVLAGDNAVVIGLAAAGLPSELRTRAILVGILAATVLRITFASGAAFLMGIIGLKFIGGLLLAWVCWNMWKELREAASQPHGAGETDDVDLNTPKKTFLQAATQIVVADVSMSLDNVLAVAGAARQHESVLVIGLILSIGLMGLAANFVARLLHKHRWIAYVGLGVIAYVTFDMLRTGLTELWPYIAGYLG